MFNENCVSVCTGVNAVEMVSIWNQKHYVFDYSEMKNTKEWGKSVKKQLAELPWISRNLPSNVKYFSNGYPLFIFNTKR